MLSGSLSGLKSRLSAVARFAPSPDIFRRNSSVRPVADTDSAAPTYQPQDGAQAALAARPTEISTRRRTLGEPEDARLTGGTRSLMRRLSGLNLGPRLPRHPITTAARRAA